MRLFVISQLFCHVLSEIGLEESFRFRKGKMKIGQRFNLKPQNVGCDVQQVATMLAVGRQEMKMIAGDAERARKPGRPQPYKSPLKVGEGEFALCVRSVDQSRPCTWRIDSSCPHTLEPAVEPQCIKDVARAPERVAACF